MIKKLLIFVLFISGCSEHENEICKQCFIMTISDALPVQFWINGVETFNQKEVCGINSNCFCQPFQCDDEIRIQFQRDEDLTEADFTTNATQYSQTSISSDRADWVTTNCNVTVDVSHPNGSEILYVENFLPEGRTFDFDYAVAGNGNYTAGGGNALSVSLCFFDSAFSILPGSANLMSASGVSKSESGTATITVPANASYFGILVAAATISAGSYNIKVTNLNIDLNDLYDLVIYNDSEVEVERLDFGNPAFGLYELSFVPSGIGLCDGKFRLSIVDSTDEELATSDCIDIRETHDCSQLIRYKNSKDFAGIEYTDFSPTSEFYIRIPAVFFHEQNTEESEQHETSGQTIVRLRNEIKLKKLLEIGYMPDYMHRKMLLVLAHDTIEIDGESWVKTDAYEKIEPTNKRYPLKMAEVLLTQQGYIKRNIL